MGPTRDTAWQTLTTYTKSESLRRHALAVEASTRSYARRFGEDEELWREGVALVQPPAGAVDGLENWLDEHERIYRSAAGARAA